MKKFVVIILVALLLPLAVHATVDLKAMTDQDLLKLNTDVVAELFSRGKTATIPVGKYTVGTHIPPGEYSVVAGKALMGSWIEVDMLNESYSDHHQYYILQTGETAGRVVLKEGDYLEVTMGPAEFTMITGMLFDFK